MYSKVILQFHSMQAKGTINPIKPCASVCFTITLRLPTFRYKLLVKYPITYYQILLPKYIKTYTSFSVLNSYMITSIGTRTKYFKHITWPRISYHCPYMNTCHILFKFMRYSIFQGILLYITIPIYIQKLIKVHSFKFH